MTLEHLFLSLWQDYTLRLCPSAQRIHQLLKAKGPLINDHIALRTFNLPPIGLSVMAQPFLALGYQACGDYVFENKHLLAKHYQHPDPTLPKVFISELEVDKCSIDLQRLALQLVQQVQRDHFNSTSFLFSGRHWDLSFEQYQVLAKESEYAAWFAAHGFGANHFTVDVNQLMSFEQVKEVNDYLRQVGFTINESGGEVKGSPLVLLEQSSTMADSVEVKFVDREAMIPGGFYEFAKRYPDHDGELYQGFVAASADKIFESTHLTK
ncbi:succinyldiaminopimelate aminotransferase [Vibrio sp. 10N.286.49.B3]|uniref:DUF1338 domain-containing protein n=1 Tax=Vibrio sp. 10N.286.49.B3 TaxID=1880855 RepID=UPI000C835A4B|nr:DUF1338 domain-containing protein [Vibrio sp. 10N.286.49.B3]PMH46295.1 succinyldiaminopimelate aminotransferase [Vibrio sp. 10N.286.49.B3]